MNKSEFLAIRPKLARSAEKMVRTRCDIAFDFASHMHWLKNWRQTFKYITTRSNHNHVINFDSYLKLFYGTILYTVLFHV